MASLGQGLQQASGCRVWGLGLGIEGLGLDKGFVRFSTKKCDR